jgi:hypothetical protein
MAPSTGHAPTPVIKPPAADKSPVEANAGTGIDTLPSPLTPTGPQIKNGEPMPSAAVPPVDKTDISKTETGSKTKTFTPNTEAPEASAQEPSAPAQGAEESAKVEELQKKIDELQKTISQLQQSPVTKEEAEKSAAQSEETAAAKVSHKKLSAHHGKTSAKTHMAAGTWVLKAAKPGVAWVARKGTDDLKMVEVGDSLAGVGRVTAIVKSSSGNWTVNGTKGRISQ